MHATRDIAKPADIVLMVDAFYDKVRVDPLIGPIFEEEARIDWDRHLPTMYRFWESLVFGTGTYRGNPFHAHLSLPIDATHFNRWLELFAATIDEHFCGELAERTKLRARSIAHIFQTKLAQIQNPKP